VKNSPTQKSLKFMRDKGYQSAVVERWNAFAGIRQDLFGWIDLVCVHPEKTGVVGVQTTTGKNVAARLEKARGNGALVAWLLAGGKLYVHGWRKAEGRWQVSEREVLLRDILSDSGEGKNHVETA
jgi:hypothetical protein